MSRRRQHGGHGNGAAPNRGRGKGRALTPDEELVATVGRTAAAARNAIGGLAAGDVVEAELVASALLSLWHTDWPADRAHLNEVGAAVLRKLAAKPDPDVLGLLLAVAALAAPPLDAVAADVVGMVRQAGVAEPAWAGHVGRPALVDAWMSTDRLGDQTNLVMTFAYEGRPPHVLVTAADANFHGLIRKAFIANDPDAVRREWRETSGLPILPIDAQRLADLLGRGIERFDAYLEPPTDEEAERLMPLLRARLRLLPTPRPIEPVDTPDDEREAIAVAFGGSPEAVSLPPEEAVRAAGMGRWFIDFACDYGAGDPLRWSPIAVEILLGDWFPRKVSLEPGEVAAVPSILRAFVRYAGRRKGLTDDVFDETIDAVDEFSEHFAEDMADDTLVGPAKRVAMRMRADGVDLADEAAVGDWIERHGGGPDAG